MKRILTLTALLILSALQVLAANIYVDKTLASDITDGSYSVANRDNSGRDGNAYNTVQEALVAISAGDTIYMRGGTYGSADLNPTDGTYHAKIPNSKIGTSANKYTLTSYPGEWAILDGEYDKAWAVLSFSAGSQSVCPKYWVFSRFEVMRGGGSGYDGRGGGIMLDTAWYCVFEYLYIHDNRSNGSENDGGICLQNDTQGPQYNTIQYCYLKDNGSPTNFNTGNIVILSDYKEPGSVTLANARHSNVIQYNFLEGGYKGIKSKNDQFLTNDNTGADTSLQEYGDKIHHNIVKDFTGKGIESRQDFQQIYNNVIVSSSSPATTSPLGILAGCNEYNTDREPFYNCIYNNTTIGCDITVLHQGNEMYSPDFHPYVWIYNNIMDNVGAEHTVAEWDNAAEDDIKKMDLNITPGSSGGDEACLDWDTVYISHNLFWPRASTDSIIYTCVVGSPYTPASLVSAGYATNLYANSTAGLHPGESGADAYKATGSFVVGSTTIAAGGIGGAHPYLSGVTIPRYVGAVNPSDSDWVAGVLSLATYTNLRDATTGSDPTWIEGSESPSTPSLHGVSLHGVDMR